MNASWWNGDDYRDVFDPAALCDDCGEEQCRCEDMEPPDREPLIDSYADERAEQLEILETLK